MELCQSILFFKQLFSAGCDNVSDGHHPRPGSESRAGSSGDLGWRCAVTTYREFQDHSFGFKMGQRGELTTGYQELVGRLRDVGFVGDSDPSDNIVLDLETREWVIVGP